MSCRYKTVNNQETKNDFKLGKNSANALLREKYYPMFKGRFSCFHVASLHMEEG